MADDRLQSAIQLVYGGKTAEARRELGRILKADPCDVPAWLWYAETYTSIEQRIQILEACLRVNPTDARVQQALAALTSHRNNIYHLKQILPPNKLLLPNRPNQPIFAAHQKSGPVPPAGEGEASSQQNPALQNHT